jgi:ATP-dependent exoDNAse (exonuclease V) beta subunit
MPLDMIDVAARDRAARTVALTDLGRTLIVEAGAGSGKTSVLAGRVVALLAAGRDPASVAAISFTELSASELRERIVTFVDRVLAADVPLDLQAAFPAGPDFKQLANLRHARDRLDCLVCTTIHGFCRTLLTPYPVEANIDPGAAMLDESEASLLFEDVYVEWLRDRLSGEAAHGDVFAALYLADQGVTDSLLRDLIEKMLDHRSADVPAHEPLTAELDSLRQTVAAYRNFISGDCSGLCPDDVAKTVSGLEAVLSAVPQSDEEAILLPWTVRLLIPEACAIDKGRAFGKRASTKKGWQEIHGTGKAKKDLVESLHERTQKFYDACAEAHGAARCAAAGRILHLMSAEARSMTAAYTTAKRARAALDFGDLIEKTRSLLAGNEVVRRELSGRFQTVLVDEFQDTDPEQLEVFWRLCSEPPCGDGEDWRVWAPRPGALFLVGDPKQAVYRFRGADLATYREARELLKSADPEAVVPIGRNFRSRKGILEWVNEQFGPCLGAEGQAGFAPLETDVPDNLPYAPVAALDYVLDDCVVEGLGAAEAIRATEAKRVATLVAGLIGRLDIRDGRGGTCKCRPCDIALLVPTGTDLWYYERALEDAGLTVAAQAGKGFFRRQEVQDFIALTRTIADARDHLALGALMRGPLVGLTDEALLDAVAEQDTGERELPPPLGLRMDLEKVSDPLLRETLRKLRELHRQCSRSTPHVLLSEAVETMNVRPILRQRGGRVAERALANLDRFLETSRAYDVRGLKAFADAMRLQWEDASKAIDARPDADEASVSLVTMHSSKGLEWPVVIPVNTAGDAMDLVKMVHDRVAGHILTAVHGVHPPRCADLIEVERKEQRFERQRLWYVTATRARDLLLVPRFVGKLDRGSWSKIVEFSLDGLAPFDDAAFPLPIEADLPGIENRQDSAMFERETEAIAAGTPRICRKTPSRADGGEAAPEVEPVVSGAGEPVPDNRIVAGRNRGRILHKLIEEVLTGETPEDRDSLVARGAELADQLGLHGVIRPDPVEMAEAVSRGLNLPEVAAIRDRLKPEWGVATSVVADGGEETLTVGVADAVAIEPDGTVSTVVDWKGDEAPAEGVVSGYVGQVRSYMGAYDARRGLLVFLTTGKVRQITA